MFHIVNYEFHIVLMAKKQYNRNNESKNEKNFADRLV